MQQSYPDYLYLLQELMNRQQGFYQGHLPQGTCEQCDSRRPIVESCASPKENGCYEPCDNHNTEHKKHNAKELEFLSKHLLDQMNCKCKCEYKIDCRCDHKTAALFLTSSQTQCVGKCNTAKPVLFDRCHIDKCISIGPGGQKIFVEESGIYEFKLTLQVFIPGKGGCPYCENKCNFRTFMAVNGCPLEESNQAVYIEKGTKFVLCNEYMVHLKKGDCVSAFIASDDEKAEIQAMITCDGEPFVPSAKLSVVKL